MNDLFAPPGYSTEFEAFWSKYPRRHGTSKIVANKAWVKARRTASCAEIMEGLEAYPFNHEAHLQPHAATWLRQARWQQFEDKQPDRVLVPQKNASVSRTSWMEGYGVPGHFIDGEIDRG